MQEHAFGRIGYVNIFVSDFQRSMQFYQEQLGLKPETQDSSFGYASFATGGIKFAFAQTDDAQLVGRHTGIGWVVGDVNDVHGTLKDAGVEFDMPPSKQPWGGYMAMFKDPDGNVFYLDQVEAGS